MRKRILSLLLALILCLSLVPTSALAAKTYLINGKSISWDNYSLSSPSECWDYAQKIYTDIWGTPFSNDFNESTNSLRNLTDSELTLTEEHLKKYVSNAKLGAVLRICNKEYLHGSDGWGHSQIIVHKDANGFTVLEGGLTAYPHCREKYYTWSEYVNTGWLGGRYGYIKYIKWPNAPTLATYSITYDANGGTGAPAAQTKDHGVSITLSTTLPKKTNSTFSHWNTKADGTGVTYAPGATYKTNKALTLYAQWIPNYVNRVYGKNRTETALAVADTMKTQLSMGSFNAIILASGTGFADALAGSYLAAVKRAPILLYTAGTVEQNIAYITKNLSKSGVVYILGGNGAVPELVENALTTAGITVKRLSGKDRYETNLAILEEAGVGSGKEILVCTGQSFADSLSASATGKPILLVNSKTNTLTDSQMAFLAERPNSTITVIGGTGAVSKQLMDELSLFGKVSRVYGANRYETSVAIANKYFGKPRTVCIAYGMNFPDGLCGGPLAYLTGAPLILVQQGKESYGADYVSSKPVSRGFVFGGTGVISNETVSKIYG